ncbi:diacylglycerol/lipid kinase family protein [Thermomonospora umbrina]|uniref:YegS/Rv2252/BmrU family lipid kinase n=1 Tax=Thermomonospora umbrina TaxID=111806 RepID=A0A3D9SGZ4_9ACTN|nr:diacylglycerol kinase family protein [Thermomonospora umbrina]REE95172.1 YegS/Rv2252/BmrU family lipid kinase [Thermomonospora umbrina]
MRSFTAVVNPSAGGPGSGSAAAALLLRLTRLLRDAGAPVDVEYSRGLEHAAELARTASGAGRVVLAVGGDGMAGCVGGALVGTDAVLGIVPAGRGNDFARQLGLPSDAEALARMLLDGEPRPVDALEANGVPVLGSVYAGVDALANHYANESRLLRGAASYYVGGVRAAMTWRPVHYRVTIDGTPREIEGFTVVAANSGYYGFGRHVAPQARVDDGLLDVVILKRAPRLLFFQMMRELADGSHVRRPQVEVLRGREVLIEQVAPDARPPLYGADGELPGRLPVKARVLPGALRILLPTGDTPDER